MSTALVTQNGHTPGEVMERVLGAGDLSQLSKEERAHYIVKVCESAGLNPLTRPFDIITLNGKPTLYASKGATDQLRRLHNITLRIVDQQRIEDVHVVTVEATTPDGRTDTDIGVVALGNAKGEALANALMKAVSKAKRRVTLSICGLGLLDESEFDTIPRQAFTDAPTGNVTPLKPAPVVAEVVDADTGEIAEPPPSEQQALALAAALKALRLQLGWDQARLKSEAKLRNVSLQSVAGLTSMVALLEREIAEKRAQDGEEDYEAIEEASAAQGTLLDAETAPIGRTPWDD